MPLVCVHVYPVHNDQLLLCNANVSVLHKRYKRKIIKRWGEILYAFFFSYDVVPESYNMQLALYFSRYYR